MQPVAHSLVKADVDRALTNGVISRVEAEEIFTGVADVFVSTTNARHDRATVARALEGVADKTNDPRAKKTLLNLESKLDDFRDGARLNKLSNRAAQRWLERRFPHIAFDEMYTTGKEAMMQRVHLSGVRGKVTERLRFASYQPIAGAGDRFKITLEGSFLYNGARWDFYADFEINKSGFRLADTGAEN